MNILIVEDHPTDRKLLNDALQAEGVVTTTAADGVEALALLDSAPFDAVITDILMPRMDGYRLVYEIRKRERLRSLPVIFYTSTYTLPGDERLSLEMGASYFLRKPAPIREIMSLVGAARAHPAPSASPPPLSVELEVMKEYSERLVTKLEERSLELEERTQELEATSESLGHLLAHSPAVIYNLRLDGSNVVPRVVSENIKQLLGFAPEETLRHEWWIGQLHPEDRQRAIDSLSETLRNGASRTEYRLIHKNGGTRWVEDNRQLIRDSSNLPKEIVGVWTDITERKKLQGDVENREQQLNAFFTGAAAGLCLLDRDLRFLQVNATLAEVNGRSVQDHIGHTIREVIPHLAPTVEPLMRKVIATGELLLNVELRGETPGQPGVERHWMGSYFPIMGKDGSPNGVGAIVVEVTEQKRVEEALRESELRFRQLAENAREVFWISNMDMSEILYVSPAYEAVWGRTCQSLHKNPMSFTNAIYSADKEQALAGRQAKPAARWDAVFRISRPDGSLRWIRDRGFPVRNEDGEPYRIAGFAEDITELKRTEEELRQSQKMEAIGRLAGGVAHDFNNLLTAILGYGELALMRLKEGDPLRHDLEEIAKAAVRAASLTRQLLTFSRKEVFTPSVLDLNDVVRDMDNLLRRLIGEDVELVTQLESNLPAFKSDVGQIEQIIMNLSVNARDAMPEGGKLILETASVELDGSFPSSQGDVPPGAYIMLAVSDTGVGMSREVRSHLFEPFFTTKELGKGTGLGLSTVYGIVKQSLGHIAVYSEPGNGSTFKMYFPRVEESVDKSAHGPEVKASRGSETILVAEDEEGVRELTRRVLAMHGYEVLTSHNGEEALEICRTSTRTIHALVTDVIMTGMSGRELAQSLIQIRPGTKILYLSGYTSGIIAHHGVFEPGVAFLQKPFSPDTLARRLRDLLDAPIEMATATAGGTSGVGETGPGEGGQ